MDEESKTDEGNRLKDVFIANGFPRKHIRTALHDHVKPRLTPRKDSNTDKKTPVLYIEGLSEKITQTCRKLYIRTAEKLDVIYQIPCECGAARSTSVKQE